MAVIGIEANRVFSNGNCRRLISPRVESAGEHGSKEWGIVRLEADGEPCVMDRLVEQPAIVEAVGVESVSVRATRPYCHRLFAELEAIIEFALQKMNVTKYRVGLAIRVLFAHGKSSRTLQGGGSLRRVVGPAPL